jgi:hypothetical protein
MEESDKLILDEMVSKGMIESYKIGDNGEVGVRLIPELKDCEVTINVVGYYGDVDGTK